MKKINLKKVTFIFYLMLILVILNVISIFVRLGGYLPENTLEAHKYIASIIFIINAIFLLFEFYIGYFKGIFFKDKIFVEDKNKIRSPRFLIHLISFLLSFLAGLLLLIFL